MKGGAQANANLDVIEEELMIEEGCENELESNRVTLQQIRVESQNYNNSEEFNQQIKNCTISERELKEV